MLKCILFSPYLILNITQLGTGKGIKSKVGGELDNLTPSIVHILVCSMCLWLLWYHAISPLILIGYGPTHANCIIRGLIACVHWERSWGFVCVGGASLHCWRRFWSLGGVLNSFGGALTFWRPFGVWRCTSAGLVFFEDISKHWMCMCAHSSIVSLDLSH
jgi:hypothetical protein